MSVATGRAVRECRSCLAQIRSHRRPDLPGKIHQGRGLCHTCYQEHWAAGTLARFPRITRRYADIAEDYEFLRESGEACDAAIASRLGLRVDTLQSAVRYMRSRDGRPAQRAFGHGPAPADVIERLVNDVCPR